MAITACPACKKPISDKAPKCSHCGFDIGNATAEDLERKASMQRFKKLQSLQNQSLLAILLFVAGFGFMYWGGVQPGDLQHNLALLTTIVGFVWYGINRARIALYKRN